MFREKFLVALLFTPYPPRLRTAPLPSHAHYQMWHCESIQHEAEEGDQRSAGRDDPKGRQVSKRLCGETLPGGGDKRRDGIPRRKKAH